MSGRSLCLNGFGFAGLGHLRWAFGAVTSASAFPFVCHWRTQKSPYTCVRYYSHNADDARVTRTTGRGRNKHIANFDQTKWLVDHRHNTAGGVGNLGINPLPGNVCVANPIAPRTVDVRDLIHRWNPQHGFPTPEEGMKKASPDELEAFHKSVRGWKTLPNGAITKTFVFSPEDFYVLSPSSAISALEQLSTKKMTTASDVKHDNAADAAYKWMGLVMAACCRMETYPKVQWNPGHVSYCSNDGDGLDPLGNACTSTSQATTDSNAGKNSITSSKTSRINLLFFNRHLEGVSDKELLIAAFCNDQWFLTKQAHLARTDASPSRQISS